jgi:outer membrane protein assembly factor BamB
MHKYTLPLLLLLLGSTALDTQAADWSNWRGPFQNGFAADTNLPDKWSPDPKAADNNLIWKAPYGGRTTPIVQNGRVYLINRVGDTDLTLQERVMCFDEKTGEKRWEYKFNVFLTGIVKDRLGWTTMAGDPETGNVYAHGTQGLLFCFDKDGKVLWQHSLTEEYGRISGYGGRMASPIIDGDLLLTSMVNASWGDQAAGRTRFVAMNKRTGEIVWWASTGFPVKDTYMSTPIVATIGGQRLVIGGGGDGGVHAFKERTGEKVWSYLFAEGSINISPVVDGTHVFIGHGEINDDGTQGKVICLDAGKITDGEPDLVWEKPSLKAKFASPIFHEGRLYICDENGVLYCLNPKDGKTIWKYKYGLSTKGSPVLADGKIYIGETDEHFYILKPEETKCTELQKQAFPSGVEINGSPAVVNGHVYFMTTTDLYCLGKKDAKPAPEQKPGIGFGEPALPGVKAAHLQIFPADVVLYPTDSVNLKVLAFDDHGQLIGPVKAEWSLAGMLPPEGVKPPPLPPGTPPPPGPPLLLGELSEKNGEATKLTIQKAPPPGQFGRVLAKVGNLTGEARVRVVPSLPYAADFSKIPEGRTPGGWVNTQVKFAIVKLEDKMVLQKTVKIPSPLVYRANAYIGPPNMTDYTIECDVRGDQVGPDLPDMGVVANRYSLVLIGKPRTLRLISWDAVPRIDKTIAYDWEAATWYRMKLTVEVQGEKAMARGKVWPRDKEEPKDWTVEITDPIGNKEGSPALYGNAAGITDTKTGTPIYYDNVKVTPNKKGVSKPVEGEKTEKIEKRPEPLAAMPTPVAEVAPPVVYLEPAPVRHGLLWRLFHGRR